MNDQNGLFELRREIADKIIELQDRKRIDHKTLAERVSKRSGMAYQSIIGYLQTIKQCAAYNLNNEKPRKIVLATLTSLGLRLNDPLFEKIQFYSKIAVTTNKIVEQEEQDLAAIIEQKDQELTKAIAEIQQLRILYDQEQIALRKVQAESEELRNLYAEQQVELERVTEEAKKALLAEITEKKRYKSLFEKEKDQHARLKTGLLDKSTIGLLQKISRLENELNTIVLAKESTVDYSNNENLAEINNEEVLQEMLACYCKDLLDELGTSVNGFMYNLQSSYFQLMGVQISTFYAHKYTENICTGNLGISKFENSDKENKKALRELSVFMHVLGIDKDHEWISNSTCCSA